jgi:hypothetical protein
VPKAARQRDARQTTEEDVALTVKSKRFRKNLWDMHNQVCVRVRILLIARSVGRPMVETKETDTSFGMLLLGAISLSDTDKLEVLQRLDQFRKWNSLDDKRYCLCCSKIITGYEIQVIGGTRGMGPMRIICPTQGCNSIPMDWALPTDEALSKYRGPAA